MLRRRYHTKEKITRKTKRGQKANASVRYSTGTQRSLYYCFENGFLTDQEKSIPFPPSQCICFTGHRILSSKEQSTLQKTLPEVLTRYYRNGYRAFISGAALGFDTVAAEAVLSLRALFPDIILILALPCPSQADRWRWEDQLRYRSLLSSANQTCLISPAYFPMCMQKRNRFMVERASVCLCYMRECRGGTWNTVSYAYDRGLMIHNLVLEHT